jgi:DNA-binding PadR family transcriptional regulator
VKREYDTAMARLKHQELLKGLIRLHVLHHAVEGEFYGQWMIEELGRHGYRLSAGTLYPMLHAMERDGYLKSRNEREGRTLRRLYRATALGREAHRAAKVKVRELFGELVEGR